MDAPNSGCLTLDVFRQLTGSSASPADVRRWASHLAGCANCAKTTRALRAGSEVLAAVTQVLGVREPLLAALRVALANAPGEALNSPACTTPAPNGDATFETLERVVPGARAVLASAAKPPVKTVANNPNRRVAASVPPPPSVPAKANSQPAASDVVAQIGPYRVLEMIGAGAVGIVYLAEDVHLKRRVALKLMRPEDTTDELAKQRFLREGRSAAALDHENVVSVYQVGEADGVPFLAMQLLQGETLDERLKREHSLPMSEVVRIAKEIAQGLSAAHDRGLIHRDIKPANIWLEVDKGRVKILDFGLARPASDDLHLTETGTVMGTPAYMSPEQARGGPVDHRTDIYSLGCVIYTMCAGRPPILAVDTMAMLIALATESPVPLRSLNPNVPPPLMGLVNQLLIKHPESRPGSVHDVLDVLNTLEKMLPRMLRGLSPDWPVRTVVGSSSRDRLIRIILWFAILVSGSLLAVELLAPHGISGLVSDVENEPEQ